MVGFVVLAPLPAHAFNCTSAGAQCLVNLKWPTRTVAYTVRVPSNSSLAPAELRLASTRAFGHWNAVTCSDIEVILAGVVTSDDPLIDANEVVPVAEGWRTGGRDAAAAALTFVSFELNSGRILGARIELNEELREFGDGGEPGCLQALDLEAVLTHEAGHFLGLSHACEADPRGLCSVPACSDLISTLPTFAELPTMWPIIGACDVTPRSLESDDTLGLCTLYPTMQSSRPCFTLPDQSTPYVRNEPFGCSSTNAAAIWPWLLLLLIPLLRVCRGPSR